MNRDTKARKALLANLATSLFLNKSVVTTEAKAKFARSYVEKMVTDAKRAKLSVQRGLASHLPHDAFIRLTKEIGPGFAQRPGGYTRIVKMTTRLGDNAPMARLELLDWQKQTVKSQKIE